MPNSPPCILVVDDNPSTLYATSRVLKAANFRVLEAETGNDAVKLASKETIDLVVLDINLPDMDGFEVCRQLRALGSMAATPVIHLSATFVNDVDKVQGLNAGADGYLTHPVEPPVLVATVNAFLRTRAAEQERRQRELEFRSIFENALNGIALIDKNLIFVDANAAMCEILKAPREAIVSRSLHEFASADNREELSEIFKRLEIEGTWRGVSSLQAADGRQVYLDWNLSRYSVPARWLAIVSDITSRLLAEREREELLVSERAARNDAERANRLKDDFLATLSHELRTPLNAIVGWAQLLKLGHLAPAETQNAVESIDRNAKAQAQIIADLLDVSRITSGKIQLDVQLLDLASVVEAALETVVPAATAKEISIIKVLDLKAGLINGDPSRLQQIVWNLVSNAVKFTPRGGKIQVAVERLEPHIQITVSDNGPGITAEVLQTIFERFRQGDASTARSERGLGLGLAIAKQLVELHGGTIHAASPGPGHGATFRVLLPIPAVKPVGDRSGKAGAAHGGRSFAKRDSAQLEGVRVLIVDDDADARRLTKRVLTDYGALPQIAADADEAMVALEEFHPHVLVSDLGMPMLDGFQFIREVRARGYTLQKLPAIALTAFAGTADSQKAISAGFQLHLVKPVDPAELSSAIAALIGR